MKLYIKKGNQKIYIRSSAKTRFEFARQFGSRKFIVNGAKYDVNEIYAEKESSNTVVGSIVGGTIGLIGGPVGFLTGATVGGLIGSSSENKEETEVKIFNQSKY